jgi:hypothetical protein
MSVAELEQLTCTCLPASGIDESEVKRFHVSMERANSNAMKDVVRRPVCSVIPSRVLGKTALK